jgi:hypothetical protein
MRTIVAIVSGILWSALAACGAFVDSGVALQAEGVCHEITPPLNNTAQLAPGGGS